ncbi:MAG: lipoyl(octanoyl) transferase LipB [Bryobacteraceae bacterium]|nr:lipoyl(octanoyl) transferase LipB [Bryobacteraceae bacterium]
MAAAARDSLAPRPCHFRDLGLMRWGAAYDLQKTLEQRRKRGEIPDQFLVVEHPHVITLGRNAREANVLAPLELLDRLGIEVHETDRGGDVTYHGPGQVVGYPIIDLREWKRDVGAYVRGIEQALIEALAGFGIRAERSPHKGETGVWTGSGKIAAIGVHLSRWVSTHGFALNVSTDLDYYRHIVPCGLTKPVTSLRALGCEATREEVIQALKAPFSGVFGWRLENTENL